MRLPFFNRDTPLRRRIPLGVPRDLSPHLMRDIGLESWPDLPRIRYHALW